MVREYIIPTEDKTKKTYKVRYMGDKLLVTTVKDKGGEYTIVPGYLKSDIYDRGWQTLLDKGVKGPVNFWNKKDGQ